MQNFTLAPTQSIILTAQFVHADASPDTGFSAPITFTADQPDLVTLTSGSGSVAPNQVKIVPTLPAAAAGGIVTITGTFVNENGAVIASPFTVTIAVNPNPAAGLLMS